MNDRWKHLRQGLFRNVEPEVKLMASMQPEPEFVGQFTTESLPGYVARWSHESPSDFNGDIERNRIMRKLEHTTPSEFAEFAFSVNGITKSLQNQWVRQRIGVAWVYRSTRFVSAEQNEFVYNTFDQIDNEEDVKYLLDEMEAAAKEGIDRFIRMRARTEKCTKQDARKIMPVFWNTPCCFKANTQSLRHLFKLRFAKKAEWEIRRMVRMIFELVFKKAPSLFEDFTDLARKED